MTRKGFFYNEENCTGCRACQVACCDKNDLGDGVTFRRVGTYEVGTYPNARAFHFSASCNHCENPACVEVCPNGATFIDETDGTVQHDDSKCIGCQYCVNACPYGVPTYLEDVKLTHKCDGCYDLRVAGEQPACVAICPMRAIEFDDIDKLRAAHPDAVDQISVLPDPAQTHPSLLIAPRAAALSADYRVIVP